jgi:hypothetical protein
VIRRSGSSIFLSEFGAQKIVYVTQDGHPGQSGELFHRRASPELSVIFTLNVTDGGNFRVNDHFASRSRLNSGKEFDCESLVISVGINALFDGAMRSLVCLLIFAAMSANATELFRDDRPDRSYYFESDAREVTAPTRFWIVTFRHSDTGKTFYAVVMPDGDR